MTKWRDYPHWPTRRRKRHIRRLIDGPKYPDKPMSNGAEREHRMFVREVIAATRQNEYGHQLPPLEGTP